MSQRSTTLKAPIELQLSVIVNLMSTKDSSFAIWQKCISEEPAVLRDLRADSFRLADGNPNGRPERFTKNICESIAVPSTHDGHKELRA